MKGKEGTGDPGGPDAKSTRYSSASGLCPFGEKGFFADEVSTLSLPILRLSRSKYSIIASLHYSCLLNEFSDIITIQGPSSQNTSSRSNHLPSSREPNKRILTSE